MEGQRTDRFLVIESGRMLAIRKMVQVHISRPHPSREHLIAVRHGQRPSDMVTAGNAVTLI